VSIVRADVRVEGVKGAAEGTVLVDTGSAMTLVDREVGSRIGVKLTGRVVKLTVADGHEVKGELAIAERVIVDEEELPGAHIVLIAFPDELRRRLRELGLSTWCILGLTTLEILGLTPDVTRGKLKKTGILLV